jgi:hypothetical protein
MLKIYSKVSPDELLHIILQASDFNGRLEIIEPNNFLQLATLKLDTGQEFAAHRHLEKPVNFMNYIAQESWVVVEGAVEVIYFDLDDLEIATHKLRTGEVSITLRGGHQYKILEDSKILEFKTGPYLGREADKVFI